MHDRLFTYAVVMLLGVFLVLVAEALYLRESFEQTHVPASFLLDYLPESMK